MSVMKIKLNRAGIRQLLKLPEVQADLARRAQAIATAAGPGMEVNQQIGANRARASVRTETTAARLAEARDRTLTRAIDAGRS